MLSLYAGVGLPAALLVPWAATRMRNPFPLVLLFLLCFVVGYLGLFLSPAEHTEIWVIAAGFGPGSFPLSLALVNLRSATTAGSAALSGFSQGLGYALAGAGPFVVGLLYEMTGGWGLAFGFLAGTLLVQVAGGAVVCRPRNVEEDLPALPRTGLPPPGQQVGATTLER
jgi:CP family cyanate transporter-like MFS transporter